MNKRMSMIWSDSRSPGTCRDCGQPLTWVTTVWGGKRLPFDGELVALQTQHNPGDHRLIEIVDMDTCHFGRCHGR